MSLSKEELLKRALDTTSFSTEIHEDLSDLFTMITPPDVPLFSRLKRTKATALLHEWTETTLGTGSSTFAAGVYADGNIPSDNTNTHVRRDNKVMSIGRIAKATNLLNATNTVGKQSMNLDAFAREMEEKIQDVMRVAEYFIFNGDRTQTSPQQMDGLANIITAANGATVINNANAGVNQVLTEANLKQAIVGAYQNGGSPDWIVARPEVCYQIANFTADKIRYQPGGAAGGVGPETLRYLSPFGKSIEIVPVRADFLPSGSVYVLDSTKIALAFLSNGIEMMDLAITSDLAGQKLIKAYLTLEVRAVQHLSVITGVADQ